MIEVNKNPSRRDLMWFGILFPVFIAILGTIIHWRFGAPSVARLVWIVGAAVTILYGAIPAIRAPFYVGWMYAVFPIGWTISHLVLAMIYYLVVTPLGIFLRLRGIDPLERELDRSADTYWKPHKPAQRPNRYLRQF